MPGAIISYTQMCVQEGASLQRGMNFRLKGRHSVILMSQRANAPYQDSVSDEGLLIYEGHDQPKTTANPDPKSADQLLVLPSGKPSENGKFFAAAERYKNGGRPELVHVYEKIKVGIWSDNEYFHLIDASLVVRGGRKVVLFSLVPVAGEVSPEMLEDDQADIRQRSRLIPSDIRRLVWARDRGRCVICGATDELHFDHILPYAKGGSSSVAENVQILCARHNLAKRDKIE